MAVNTMQAKRMARKAAGLSLTGLMLAALLAAGCANRKDPNIAPSREANGMPMTSGGWSVPPGAGDYGDHPAPQDQGSAGEMAATPNTGAGGWSVPPAGVGGSYPASGDNSLAPVEDTGGSWNTAAPKTGTGNTTVPSDNPGALTATPLGGGRGTGGQSAMALRPEREEPVQPIVPAFPLQSHVRYVPGSTPVFFGFDQDGVSPEAQRELEAIATWMRDNPGVAVRIEGHADERGTPEYNLALGERRAIKVRERLIMLGAPAENLLTMSYGEEMPRSAGKDETAYSQNRRTEFSQVERTASASTINQPPLLEKKL